MRFSLFLGACALLGTPFALANAQLSTPQTPAKAQAAKLPAVKPDSRPGHYAHPSGSSAFLVPGSDSCATPDVIAGAGPHAFSTLGMTTGTEGQTEAICNFFSSIPIYNDVWFVWTAPSTGTVTMSLCTLASFDTKIAAYAGSACPTAGTAIACNDDFCGLQSQMAFSVTAGQPYMLQIGSYGSATTGSGSFTMAMSAPPVGNDSCAAPVVITGTGTFPVDNTAATTGSPVATCGAMGRDVWFRWTAPTTGIATINTCGQVSADSVLAIWSGTGIPTGGCPTTQLACNDDACSSLQSSVSTPVTAGADYFIEAGSFASGAGYVGTFTINVVVPSGNDACSAALAVVGNGPHAFDTTGATTGAEGQTEGLCLAFGTTAIYNDLWFTWTAGTTSLYEISLCGSTGFDSRVAVYAGAGCPAPGTAIACNDDFCGLVSAACFSATAGQTYTIQIGAYSTAGFGAGSFQLTPSAPPVGGCTPQDDGTSENSVGLTAGGGVAWMVGFGAAGQSATVNSIQTCFGTPLYPGGYFPSGPVTVVLWNDPNDDGNPTDAVWLAQASATVSPGSVDTDVYQTITLTTPVTVNGVFFVGASVSHPAGQYPGPLDQSATGGSACGSGGAGSWVFGNTAAPIDLVNINNNNVLPQSMASVGIPGNWLLRVDCGPGVPGTGYCFGDGTGAACPCANNGTAGNGCANSVNAAGGNIAGSGLPSLGADSLVLLGTGMPNSSALYFQGTAQISVGFGDGLRCVGGTIARLGTKSNVAGASQYPQVGNLPVSVRGNVLAPGTRNYQIWYRNAAAFCTTATFNLTNGLQITWIP